MSSEHSTTISVLTPPGRGAVATLLVSGPAAVDCVAAIFSSASGRPLRDEPVGNIAFGRWGSGTGEEVIVCRLDADRLEIHCHGGHAAAAEISRSLVAAGCQPQTWREWLAKVEDDPLSAAARAALAEAPTERTAAVLLDQHHGALRRAIDEILEMLDRDDPAAIASLEKLLDNGSLSAHLTTPWKVVLSGRPNVGKSSLINALLGYERAIVHSTPGTTRDVLTGVTALDGWPVEFSDTAGLRATDDAIEAAGVARARQSQTQADLVLLLFDASQPWSPEDEVLLADWPTAVVVWNKCDLAVPPVSSLLPPASIASAVRVSALTRDGLDDLVAEIARRLVPRPVSPGSAVPFTRTQYDDLEEAAGFVSKGEYAAAANVLRARAAWKLRLVGQAFQPVRPVET